MRPLSHADRLPRTSAVSPHPDVRVSRYWGRAKGAVHTVHLAVFALGRGWRVADMTDRWCDELDALYRHAEASGRHGRQDVGPLLDAALDRGGCEVLEAACLLTAGLATT